MNPDANINVWAVYPDGTATLYSHADETGFRHRIRTEKFKTRGEALLMASDYEVKQRAERDRRGK